MLSKKQSKKILKDAYWLARNGDKTLLSLLTKHVLSMKQVKAKNTEQVLSLLEQGKISAQEAQALMSTLKGKMEIEEIPKLMKQLEALSKKQR